MVRWLGIVLGTLRSAVRTHRELALENLALRHQLAVCKARQPRPRLTEIDRIFWVLLSRLWTSWRHSLLVVRPQTVIGWHRQGFRRARLIPFELDDAARADGASAAQVYLSIYVPLMSPALAVVATYALLVAWNDYLFQFTLLSSSRNMTIGVTQALLFDDPDAAWNAMMAVAIIYALPPLVIFGALRRYMAVGLTRGVLKS